MRLAALFSGGKDSTYATHLVELAGNNVDYLLSVIPQRGDSYMFHDVNIRLTRLHAEALKKEYIAPLSSGRKEAELEDLKRALSPLDIDGVVSGAIASNYQRSRIDKICLELGIVHISPLWERDRLGLMEEMLEQGMMIMIISVAALGLDESWLGIKIDEGVKEKFVELNQRFGVDICGEGGEYETLVLDAPWFDKRIRILDSEIIWMGDSGRYLVKEALLEEKVQKS
jgi:ABC transporter with metal-binding/Fe-S-binding domain ATP-binding protein